MCKDGIVMGGRWEWRKNRTFNVCGTLFLCMYCIRANRRTREGMYMERNKRLRWSFNVWENVFAAEKMNRAALLSYLLLKSRSSLADQQASGLIMYLHSKNIHPDTSFTTPLSLFTCLSPAIIPLWFRMHKFFQGISINYSLMLRLLSLWHF